MLTLCALRRPVPEGYREGTTWKALPLCLCFQVDLVSFCLFLRTPCCCVANPPKSCRSFSRPWREDVLVTETSEEVWRMGFCCASKCRRGCFIVIATVAFHRATYVKTATNTQVGVTVKRVLFLLSAGLLQHSEICIHLSRLCFPNSKSLETCVNKLNRIDINHGPVIKSGCLRWCDTWPLSCSLIMSRGDGMRRRHCRLPSSTFLCAKFTYASPVFTPCLLWIQASEPI